MYFRSLLTISLIVVCVFALTRCMNREKQKGSESVREDVFKNYAGSEACANCHKDVYEKHIHTEHHLTSSPATSGNILGSFKPDKNIFVFEPFVNVTMEKRDSGFYQVEYNNDVEIRKGRIDIVTGSGRKGQTYLNWIGNRLVQLPITYFTPASQWSNSPGFSPHKARFYRPISARCLECHSTYFEKTNGTGKNFDEFDRNKIIYAVDCEKCHGPGKDHVEFQTKNPALKQAKFIVNPGKLSRERLMDLCSLCHGGPMKKTKPSFQFQAGDTLSNYFEFFPTDPNISNIDVHGNQAGLLSLSKCFTMSNMTCISCHSVHENEKDKIEIFSQRCMNCHSNGLGKLCKMTSTIGGIISQNCIDCHMPKQPSHAVAVYLQGAEVPTPALMRTHLVKIYPDETKKFLEQLKSKKSSGKK
jgi:hypothetical protein